tara:strand:+ start:815 stop:1153 length:339 start_codon:yes stop_codon:yes gene_type:complete
MNLETLERKQRQLIVHSFIYYNLNENIWPDSKWDKTAKEVFAVREQETFKQSKFYKVFTNFDGCTGYNLTSYQYTDETDILNTQSYQHHFMWLAEHLLKIHSEQVTVENTLT